MNLLELLLVYFTIPVIFRYFRLTFTAYVC